MKKGNWNPARVLAALGKIGYNPVSAILDIADNAVSANCNTLAITIVAKKVETSNGGKRTIIESIFIVDDGSGMDEAGIDNALSLGSSEELYDEGTLSKFGMGLKSAASSLGRCLEITTRMEGGRWLQGTLDQDVIIDEGEYVYDFSSVDEGAVEGFFPERDLDKASGTIIKISKIHSDSMSSVAEIINNLVKRAGVVYNYYLLGQIDDREALLFTVNGEAVESFDPLFIDEIDDADANLNENAWDAVSVKWITTPQVIQLNAEGTLTAEVSMTQLPHPPTVADSDILTQKGCRDKYMIGAGNYGFYIYRNGRLISWADSLEMVGQDQDLYSFRGRLQITSDADEALNIDVTKSRIHLSELAKEQLIPLVQEAKKKSFTAWGHAKSELRKKVSDDPHNTISGDLDDIGKLLEKDDAIDETVAAPEEKKKLERRRNDASITKRTTPEESEKLREQGQRVQYTSSLDNNQLWERAHDPDVGLIVKVNQSHRLYKELIESQQDNAPLIKTLDIMFFALARGEWSLIYKSDFDQATIEVIVDEYRERVGNELSDIIKRLDVKRVLEG